jgi:hypothetical protein
MKQMRFSMLLVTMAAMLSACAPGLESSLGRAAALGAATTTNFVFAADITLSGASQGTNTVGDFIIVKQSLVTADVVNLARGRALGAAVPINEVLAAAAGGTEVSPDLRLIVYDSSTQSNLATVAIITDAQFVVNSRGAVAASQIDVQPAGDATNGLNGGHLGAAGKVTANPLTLSINLTTAVLGHVEVTINGTAVTLVVPKGKLSLKGAPIGQLIE